MLRWAITGCWVLGLLVVACADEETGDGPGTSMSPSTANPADNGAAAAGTMPAVGIGGANTGAAASRAGASAAGAAGDDDEASAGNTAEAGSAAAGTSGASASAGGAAGNAGAGNGGADPGNPGMGGTNGNGRCDLVCPVGTRCALVDVTCIQAPCNPVPECVAAGMGGRGGDGSGGSAGTAGSGTGAICGTRGAPPCADGQFCNHPIGADCGRADAPGTCEPRPRGCTREFVPVCGCDGKTYGNACTAASAGVSIERDGEC